ncbi:MAG: HAMP domain-containing histidine kinase [Agathobacter sp.]|nr:HAMP domain-containing histidine kinase [Agathobacter sp.]
MKEKQDFQIFIISRFLVSLIYVVLSEFLIWFATDRIKHLFQGGVSMAIFIAGIIIMIIPIIVASLLFSKALVDEVHRMNQEKEEMRKGYEKKRNLMLSDIAHDLRTPITTIAGYSKALNDDMVISEEKKKEYLQAIENKSARMNDLINLLFEYVRLDSANYGLRKDEIDLSELLRTIAASLYSDVEEKGMEFQISIPEEVHLITLDRVQFSRVIVNLINNAIKHNEKGTVISLEMKPEKDKIVIEVSDNGGLIPTFLAEQIFEPFAMGDASRTAQSGSGLGLSIAKKIVEMHGWSLELKQYYEEYRKSFIIEIK